MLLEIYNHIQYIYCLKIIDIEKKKYRKYFYIFFLKVQKYIKVTCILNFTDVKSPLK